MVAAYNYSNRSNLMNVNRDFITTRQDLRRGAVDPSLFTGILAASGYAGLQTVTPAAGPGIAGMAPPGVAVPYPSDGGNFQNLTSCPVATISTSSANSVSVFTYPYTVGVTVPRQTTPSGGPGTGICDTGSIATALPSEVRNQGIVSLHQALNDKLSMNLDVVYAARLGSDRTSRGSVTNAATFNLSTGGAGPAFGSNQDNPFFVAVPGTTGTSRNSEFVSLSFDQLLAGQGVGFASSKAGQTTVFSTIGLDYDLGGDWLLSLGGTSGTDVSFNRTSGTLNSAETLLALNGTVNTGGTANNSASTSASVDTYGLNTIVSVTRALTTANALDVWNPPATNRTNASVLRSLVDSAVNNTTTGNLQNATIHADGPLGDFWGAGQIKAAFGGEWIHYTKEIRNTRPNSTGPNSTSALFNSVPMGRSVYATYAEFVVPVIGPDMGVPLMQKLVFDFAGRYDRYSDFGETKNPKIAVNWDIVDGIRASGSFGTSFTAPSFDSTGQPGTGLSTASSISANNSGAANGLVVLFNDTRPFNGGAGIAGTFVSTAAGCAAAGSTPVTDALGNTPAVGPGFAGAIACKIVNSGGTGSQGLTINGGNPNLKPELGQTYSANLVFDEFGKFWDVLEGLSAQFTYYQAKFTGAITNIGIVTSQTNAGIPQLTTFGPLAGTGGLPGWTTSDAAIQEQLNSGRPLQNPLPARLYSIQIFTQQNAFNLWQNGLDFKVGYRFATDTMGDFNFGLSGNQILRASQSNGAGLPVFNTLDGANGGRFPDIEFTGRATVNWHMDPFTVGLAFSFQHPYNIGVTTFPFNLPGPNRLANTEHISALQFIDLNIAYDLPGDMFGGMANGTQLSLNINNLFDTSPPYQDNSTGMASGSAIGRLVNIGLRKKW